MSESAKKRIVVLPGLGANGSMYGGVWRELEGAEFLDWPRDYVPGSIEDLAGHMAKKIEGRVDCVVGSSLGGMVGLELADLIGAESVVLIGSAVCGDEVNRLQRWLRPLWEIVPFGLCGKVAGLIKHDLAQMYSEQNPRFVRAMIGAVGKWSYGGDVRRYRIHGRRDFVIGCKEADLWLDGGHLLAMTDGEACVEAIEKWLEGRDTVTKASGKLDR